MRARPKSQIFRSQFSLMRMLEGLRSRWTTPAEWTYLRPRWWLLNVRGEVEGWRGAHQDLVEEILNELLLERSRGEEAV